MEDRMKAKITLGGLLVAMAIAPTVSVAQHRETERDIAPGSSSGPGTPGGVPNPGNVTTPGQQSTPPQGTPSSGSSSEQRGTSSPSTQPGAGPSSSSPGPGTDDAVTGGRRRTEQQ
jgi:hypothetical protein